MVDAVEALLTDRELVVAHATRIEVEDAQQGLSLVGGRLEREEGGSFTIASSRLGAIVEVPALLVRSAGLIFGGIDLSGGVARGGRHVKSNPVVTRTGGHQHVVLVLRGRVLFGARGIPAGPKAIDVRVDVRLAERVDGHSVVCGVGVDVSEHGVVQRSCKVADHTDRDGVNRAAADVLGVIHDRGRGLAISAAAVGAILHHDFAAVLDRDVVVGRQRVDAVVERTVDRIERDFGAVVVQLCRHVVQAG